MTFDTLRTDSRAVTPVIGKTVVVGVTVLLAATAAVFFTGIADEVTTSPPSAAFQSAQYGNAVTVTHTSGDAIDPSELYVRYGDTESPWADVGAASAGEVSAGDAATLSVSGETTVEVRWRSGEESAVLYREAFSAPVSATFSGTNSGINESGKDGSYAGFGNKHLEARGKTAGGHFRAGHEMAEVRDTSDTVRTSKPFTPNPGTAYTFTLQYDGSTFTFSIGGWSVTTGAFVFDDGALSVQLKLTDDDVDEIRVSDLKLDGASVGSPSSFAVDTKTEKSLVIEDSSMNDGFALTGTVVYDFDPVGMGPTNEEMVLRIDVA